MKPVKALILGILLLVPILIFIFISVFGTHHFSLDTLYPKLDDNGQVVYNSAGDTVFHTVPYFEMLTQTGDTLKQTDLNDVAYVAHFFDPSCPSPCQNIFTKIVRLQEAYENIPGLEIVSISRMPLEDSLQVLAKLSDHYHVNADKWHLVTGDAPETKALNQGLFPEFYRTNKNVENLSDQLVLVDKEKKIRGVYSANSIKEIDRLITEINVLLDEYSKRK